MYVGLRLSDPMRAAARHRVDVDVALTSKKWRAARSGPRGA